MARIVVHPGEIIREDVIESLGLSITEVAKRLGVSRVALSRVVHEHAAISPRLALLLENAGVSTARFWLALQAQYDLEMEKRGGLPTVTKLSPVA